MSKYSVPLNESVVIRGLTFSHESHDDGGGDIHNYYISKGSMSASLEWATDLGTWSVDDEPAIGQRDMRTINSVLEAAIAEDAY